MSAHLLALLRTGLFRGVPDETVHRALQEASPEEVAPGTVVLHEGDPGGAFYVVVSGQLEVHTTSRDGSRVVPGHFSSGDHFGEQAWLTGGGVRTASVTATSATDLLRVDLTVLQRLTRDDPSLQGALEALGRTYRENRLSRRSSLVRALVASMPAEERDVVPGEVVVRAGEAATHSYVVLVGAVVLHEPRGTDLVRVRRLGPGLSLGNRSPHSHTAIAEVPGRLLVVPHGALDPEALTDPGARHQLAAVARVWTLPRQGVVTQVVGEVDGAPCIDLHYALHDGRTVVASQLVDDAQLRVTTTGIRPTTRLSAPDGVLYLDLDSGGAVRGFSAHTRDAVVAAAMGWVLEGRVLSPAEQATWAETGTLAAPPPELVCTCLQVPRARAAELLAEDGLDVLRRRTGAGTVCGSCVPTLQAMAGDLSFLPVVVDHLSQPRPGMHRVVLRSRDGSALPASLAGQSVVLRASIAGRPVDRTFTLCSAPGQPWEVLTRCPPGDAFRRWLDTTCAPGLALLASTPAGDTTWNGGPAPVLVFVAGRALALALSIVRQVLAEGWPHRVVVDWSVRDGSDHPLLETLSGPLPPNITVHVRQTRHADRLDAPALAQHARRFPSAVAFVCGPPSFRRDVTRGLIQAGLPKHRVREASARSG